MRIRLAIPDRHITPEVLESVLEATTRANQGMLAAGEAPGIEDAIRKGLRWKPEPYTDGEHFDLASHAHRRGWGDCDDLAPWLAAEMRHHGVHAVPKVYRSGPGRYHVVVQDGEGRIHDPSKWAGMGKRGARNDSPRVSGIAMRPMGRPGEGALCVLPHGGRWHARTDLPWDNTHAHIASTASARSPEAALERSIAGALYTSESATTEGMLDSLLSVGEHLLSTGSLFGSIAKLAAPLAKAASSFVPGGSLAFDAAEAAANALKGGGGGGGGGAPGAPGAAPGGAHAVQCPTAPDAPQAWIYYHPTGAPGPVVARLR
jgi:hypothetical protein